MTAEPEYRKRLSKIRPQLGAGMVLVLSLGLGVTPSFVVADEAISDTQALDAQGGKKKHRKRQQWPIQLGTSGGNIEDLGGTFFDCCSGTLGALIEKNGVHYILSNTHVLSRSNTSGAKGEAIVQPGYLDQGAFCSVDSPATDTVAHLTSKKKIKFDGVRVNKADVAIAEVVPGAVHSDGKILRIGVPGSQPVPAVDGMQVKKAGRTTGLTRGTVFLTNAAALVNYPEVCGSESMQVARFDGLVFVRGNGRSFSGSGDSGAMVYLDVDDCPPPVGLLFAGSPELTALIPATTVKKFVKRLKPKGPMDFVGCSSSGLEASAAQTQVMRPERSRGAVEVMREWEDSLFAVEGVHSVGVGLTLSGPVEPAIYVLTSGDAARIRDSYPDYLDGYRVEVLETPRLSALSASTCSP